jgi:hypothetical protein
MSNFTLEVTSVPDRTKLVAEIWFNDDLLAEVSNETGQLKIEFYSQDVEQLLPFDDFIETLTKAKEMLRE